VRKVISIMLLLFCVSMVWGCGQSESVIRIHIRANSNLESDQQIKLLVRDNVIDYITPLIADCSNSDDVKMVLLDHIDDIENVADAVLRDGGYNYVSNAELRNEYFPTRAYNDVVFESDYYDALILELGSGKGDNWWCVAYPPLCFVGESDGTDNITYKSKIIELINKFFG